MESETDIRLDKDLAVLSTKVDILQVDINEIKQILKNLQSDFVTQKEFEPIKRGFYGLIAAVAIEILGIFGAVIVWLLTR